MYSFVSRDISSMIQHNSKTNDCMLVCVRKMGVGGGGDCMIGEREREKKREREGGGRGRDKRGGRGKREEFALSYVSHCCGCTFTVGLIKGSSFFDAWSVVCFIGSDCLCVKVCRLTTVI